MNQFSREIKWVKKNCKLVLFWGIIIFVLIPQIIFIIVKDDEHLGFLGGYVGAILTLGGVWFQIQRLEKHRRSDEDKREEKRVEEKNRREKEEKENERKRKIGILNYLKFVLERNYKGGEKNKCAYLMQITLSYISGWNSYKENVELFAKFKSQFIDNNLNVIMEFESNIGEEILRIDEMVNEISKDYNYLLKHIKERENLFQLIKEQGGLKGKVSEIKGYNEGEIDPKSSKEIMEEFIEEMGFICSKKETELTNENREKLIQNHVLDKNLNGKGFEIIDKSKELLEKVKKEIKKLG